MDHAKKRILISDCDPDVLITLERVLEDAGFDTTTAMTQEETVRLLAQGDFDLLLAADHPPELSCAELLRRSHAGGPPLIALESRERHPFVEPYLLALGAKKIVHKWEPQQVQAAVMDLLTKQPREGVKSAVAGKANLG